MVSIRPLSQAEAQAYAPLTFPAYRAALARPAERPAVYVGAMDEGEPVAFAFAIGGAPDGGFELVSLYVSPLHRRHGLGGAMLAAIENALGPTHRYGAHFLTVREDQPGPALFLVRHGWRQGAVRQVVCRMSIEAAHRIPWRGLGRARTGDTMLAWDDVPAGPRDRLKAALESGALALHDTVEPFQYEGTHDRATSVALLRGGDLVGWVITHPLDADTLRWTCSYVLPGLQTAGRVIPLWWSVVERQTAAARHAGFIWTVPMDLPRMAAFARERLRPHADWLGYACTFVKDFTR